MGNSYRLGAKLAQLGAVFLSSVDLVREFQDACITHNPPAGQTTKLAVLGDHGDTIYLSRHDPIRPASLIFDFGVQQPAHCTSSGKAMLACLPEEEFLAWSEERGERPPTRHSLGTLAALRDELEIIRTSGVAFDAEECHDGVFCVGTALANLNDPSDVLGLSFVILRQQATDEVVANLSSEITRIAEELSARLGGGYLTLSQLMGNKPGEDGEPSPALRHGVTLSSAGRRRSRVRR